MTPQLKPGRRNVALDSNLLVLWITGLRFPEMVGTHKRLQAYSSDDFDVLQQYLLGARIVTTPNTMTEVSNLIVYGVKEPQRSALLGALGAFTTEVEERYVATETAAKLPAFTRLGVADAAWLDCVADDVDLLTDDLALYLAALKRGLSATNFNHLRDA